jgi:hypothetical protein
MLLDTLLVERSKALMSKMGDMLHDDKLPPGQVKLVSQMLEVLQNGTQARSFFFNFFYLRASEACMSDVGGAAKWDPGRQFFF